MKRRLTTCCNNLRTLMRRGWSKICGALRLTGQRSGGALSLLLWSTGLLALALAALLRNPLLFQWRMPASMLVIAAAGGVIGLIVRGKKLSALRYRGALLALWLGVPLLAGVQEARFRLHKQHVLNATDARARMLGAHMIVGYDDPQAVKTLVTRGLVGGIFITAHNVRNRSQAAIEAELTVLQMLRQIAGLPPLIVTTDQEGGIVSRMSPPLAHFPPLAEIIAEAKPQEVEALAFAYGTQQGRELAALGVNVNFAPLADLALPSAGHRLDLRSLINRRAIAADPGRVSSAVIGYAHGLEASGVRATLKHFPGLGRVSADTHIQPARLSASEKELAGSDWIPFQAGLRATQSLLMVGHATLSAVDPDRPASRSAAVIQGIVRQRWGHDGILVTDDLTMGAVVAQGLCSAGVDALNAGIDLLLVSYDADQYYEIFDCLLQAETLDRQRLAASQRRLEKLQRSLPQQQSTRFTQIRATTSAANEMGHSLGSRSHPANKLAASS